MTREQLDRRKSAELGLLSAAALRDLDERTAAAIDAVAERLQAALAELTSGRGVDAELRSVDGEAAKVVPQYARHADLCILGADEPEGAVSVGYTFSEQLLFATGLSGPVRPG